jgi:KipI family sensor histidine kinase inhibitor
VGDAALTLELGETIDDTVSARVRAVDEALRARPFPGFIESVPTHRSLLVVFDPDRASLGDASRAVLSLRVDRRAATEGRLHVLPTLYGGDAGPDLESVAARTGLSAAAVIARHTSVEYTARMLGFVPGFAYLGPLPAELEMPRLATPRTRVPAGSVAIAGRQTAVYPAATPGGWNLIGRSTTRLFDPFALRPSRIEAGDRVRFEAVARLPEVESSTPPACSTRAACLEVLDGGLLTTIQDRGRPGWRRFGVSAGGAADAVSSALANAVLGNAPQAAVLECTLSGPRLRFLSSLAFAIAGADLGAVLQREDLGPWPVPQATRVLARAGNVLSFNGRRHGCRAYLAFAGGLDVPPVLSSRSTDLGAGFGGVDGRALRGGDRLATLPSTATPGGSAPAPVEARASLRVVLGPQAGAFDTGALRQFLRQEWQLASSSDRVGLRLEGEPLRGPRVLEIVSDGMLPGSVQVPPDGRPIVMLADAPTTGGYPKIATVVSVDLPYLAQLAPGVGRVRFESA